MANLPYIPAKRVNATPPASTGTLMGWAGNFADCVPQIGIEMAFKFPDKGFVFWPVGTGDSTTVCVNSNDVLQIDLHHLALSDEEGDPRVPIVDRLIKLLPRKNDRPYLAVFCLTHPDQDHCLGFETLRKSVEIGEIWFTPRIFAERTGELCDDAQDFVREAKRRVKKTIENGGKVDSGDCVRIIGYDSLLEKEDYEGFPPERLTRPGSSIVEFDGKDHSYEFNAFVHAPFKDDDGAAARNETSVGLRVEISEGEHTGEALLLGDLSYPSVKRVFDETERHGNNDKLKWDVFLAPHHCSKSVMYWKDEGETEATLKQDILDRIEEAAEETGYIIASCDPVPASNSDGDNPPHIMAKQRYEEVAPNGFMCTGEHSSKEKPQPIVFVLTNVGFAYVPPSKDTEIDSLKEPSRSRSSLAEAISLGQGQPSPPSARVGFGWRT